MKAITIALKDMTQSFRSLFAIAFMFVIPILVTSMFALIFGGGGEEEAFQIATIPVQIANQDNGQMGGILAEIFQSEDLADLLAVTASPDAAAARAAVDNQQAQVAIIIPADFTTALYTPGAETKIELYQDPTLSLGPGIVATIVNQFTVGFSGSSILLEVTGSQLAENGLSLTPEQQQALIGQYTQAVQSLGGEAAMLKSETPGGEIQQTNTGTAAILSGIMGGMMIFYAFFTGTYASNTILKEQEEGTLARLFSTATPRGDILVGKLMAAALMILVQISVLLLFGWLVFDILWGQLWLLAIFTVLTTFSAATFGMAAISLAKDRKQAGAITGVGVTVTGMLGMSKIFMLSSPAYNPTIGTMTLFVPQGWANSALLAISDAQPAGEVFLLFAGLLVWSAALFLIGFTRFKKRFA